MYRLLKCYKLSINNEYWILMNSLSYIINCCHTQIVSSYVAKDIMKPPYKKSVLLFRDGKIWLTGISCGK